MLAGPRVASTTRSPWRARQARPSPTRCWEMLRVFPLHHGALGLGEDGDERSRQAQVERRPGADRLRDEVSGVVGGGGRRALRQYEQLAAITAPCRSPRQCRRWRHAPAARGRRWRTARPAAARPGLPSARRPCARARALHARGPPAWGTAILLPPETIRRRAAWRASRPAGSASAYRAGREVPRRPSPPARALPGARWCDPRRRDHSRAGSPPRASRPPRRREARGCARRPPPPSPG